MQRTRDIVKKSRQRQTKRRLRKGVIALSLLLFIVLFGVIASHYHRFLIQEIVLRGTKTVSEQELIAATDQLLNQSYYWLIPKRNKWFLPEAELSTALLAGFPRLASVTIDREDNVLALEVGEREGVALWCLDQERCYFIDDVGYIFAEAPKFTGAPFYVIEAPLVGDPIGQQPLVGSEFRNLFGYLKQIDQALAGTVLADTHSRRAVRGEAKDWSLFVANDQLDREIEVKISVAKNHQDAVANLVAALKTNSFESEFKANPRGLNYLDLRFPPKVFYKFDE